MFFNIFHELIPENKENYGRRNSKVFLLGILLYCVCYIILMNFYIYDYISKIMFDAIYWVCFILFISDCSVMAYEYKNYFGRTIFNEIGEENKQKWKYNEKTHKYINKLNNVVENNILEDNNNQVEDNIPQDNDIESVNIIV